MPTNTSEMLRASIARAADVTMDLVQLAGSMNGKVVLHPELARLRKPPTTKHAGLHETAHPWSSMTKDAAHSHREVLREAATVVTAQSGFECSTCSESARRQIRPRPSGFEHAADGRRRDLPTPGALRARCAVMLCTGCVQQERLNHMLEAGLCDSFKSRSGRGNMSAACAPFWRAPPLVTPIGRPPRPACGRRDERRAAQRVEAFHDCFSKNRLFRAFDRAVGRRRARAWIVRLRKVKIFREGDPGDSLSGRPGIRSDFRSAAAGTERHSLSFNPATSSAK